ncbi:MAG: SDR family NAD(P)-dependent oxidoreductase [Candidatus Nanopelagicales bacterium]
MDCTRPHVVITDTATEVGEATILAALSSGFHVFAAFGAGGPVADMDHVDLTAIEIDDWSPEGFTAAASVVAEHVGEAGLDGLVSIADTVVAKPLETTSADELLELYRGDVAMPLALTQSLLPLLRQGPGRIVFVGPIGRRASVPFAGAMQSSTAALAVLSSQLRRELAPWGINVGMVAPESIHATAAERMQADADAVRDSLTDEHAELYGQSYQDAMSAVVDEDREDVSPGMVAYVVVESLTASSAPTKSTKVSKPAGGRLGSISNLSKLPASLQQLAARSMSGLPGMGSSGH